MKIYATLLASALAAVAQGADETTLRVDAGRVIHRVSPLLYGACIEDVNHEIYGGLYSQMIFGESFQEPPRLTPLKGLTAYGGQWTLKDEFLDAAPGDGPKLMADLPPFADGDVGVEIKFPSDQGGNASMIVRVDRPRVGADTWVGYEVALETAGFLMLGRHRDNWEPIRRVPCKVPVDRWVSLVTRMNGPTLEILVDGKVELTYEDTEHPLVSGGIGLRTWQRPARYRNFWYRTGDRRRAIAFERERGPSHDGISGMWTPTAPEPFASRFRQGEARGEFAIETREPFVGRQSQRLTRRGGSGSIGLENRGLNRWGMNLVEGRPYEGYVWARAEKPTKVRLALETGDGKNVLAEQEVEVKGDTWARYDFRLTPKGSDARGRFAVKLWENGSVDLGHAFLQPGDWGRFKGLPVRKDVADALVDQGIAILRYGGSMINHPLYRWKEMIGPRDRRPMHAGLWYAHSTNGWGIFDFLAFCKAAGFVGIPAVNMGETPQDMADFIEYANGAADSEWGKKRVADGHPEPFGLKHIELGNEEKVDEDYFKKFAPIAEAIWAKDPGMILVVGDFAYNKVIEDPYKIEGSAGANSLAAHKKILELAKANNREVWFDTHVWTDHPPEPNGMKPERSLIDQLGKLAPGAKYKVVIFEYNSGNHAMKRALSNALATNEAERIGDLLPIALAANCLQPDGQNDNGWDQGLLFLNPSKTWFQPPGYLFQMARRHFQPLLVQAELSSPAGKLSVNAKRSDDGKILALQVVNVDDIPRPTRISVEGFNSTNPSATVEELAGPLEAVNTADQPERISPRRFEWKHELAGGKTTYTFPPRSITIIRLE
jgi:hypothetical protein